jgi:hypothetical protein
MVTLDNALTPYRKHVKGYHMSNVATVPNGTEIHSPNYVKLVEQYKLFARKTAENIIGLAETLVIAEDQLAPFDFRRFCRDVGLEHDGSTFRKLKAIGEKVSRFEPFVERMPNTWTTVYKLASLKDNEFDRVTKSELFTPFMTATDVNLIVGAPKQKSGHQRDLIIDLSGLDQSVKIDLYRKVMALEEQFKFKLTVSDELKTCANNAVSDSAQVAA